VIVPVFQARQPTPYTITVTMSAVPAGQPFLLGRDLEVVLDQPGWYRGDLHAHTPASSDAWKSGSALTPRQWADECRRIGLDFLALTDHNVVSQNFAIADDAGQDVLLMAGEEMTNWFHGHATVSGITPGDWFDWRQRPAGELSTRADPREGSIQQFVEAATASGAFVSVAHPLAANLSWQFFPEAAADPAARTQGLEVWTGQFQPDDEAALRAWDGMLAQGQRIFANGGSDLHGTENNQGFASGTPTTVVHAQALSKRAVVAALQAGRSFITRLPDGVELYLSATGVDDQRQVVGGTVFGAPTDRVEVEVLVRRAAGMRLLLVRDGAPVTVVSITEDEQVVRFSTPVGSGGYVRAEVRSSPLFVPGAPLSSRTDMEAFTNPVFLAQGPVPPGTARDDTAPPAQAGPRRSAAPAPEGALARADPAPADSADPSAAPLGRALPATGAPALLPVAGAALAGAALLVRRMTLTELRVRAASGDSLAEGPVLLVGQVTAARPGLVVLTRWVPGCCSTDAPVDVEVLLDDDAAVPGSWWEVEGDWLPGTGAGDDLPRVRARTARPVVEPPPAREA
jgi:predicted metal-dependent phosphoesterase TrpH